MPNPGVASTHNAIGVKCGRFMGHFPLSQAIVFPAQQFRHHGKHPTSHQPHPFPRQAPRLHVPSVIPGQDPGSSTLRVRDWSERPAKVHVWFGVEEPVNDSNQAGTRHHTPPSWAMRCPVEVHMSDERPFGGGELDNDCEGSRRAPGFYRAVRSSNFPVADSMGYFNLSQAVQTSRQ